MPFLRLFIAADISSEQRAACAQLIEDLKKGVQFTKAYPKWVEVDKMHLTLKFLGNVEAGRVSEITQAIDPIAVRSPRFTMGFRGLGAFPTERQPRIIWIGVQVGRRNATALAGEIEQALIPLGFPPEDRPFHPHLTLARVKSMRDAHALMDILRSHHDADLGETGVDHLTLYQSTLMPEGPVYRALHTWPLPEPQVPNSQPPARNETEA